MQRRIPSMDEASRPAPPGSDWRSASLDPGIGACRTERYTGGRGLSMAYTSYAPSCDLVEESNRATRGRTLTITVALSGESGFRCSGGNALRFRGGYTTVVSSCATVGERHFAQGKPVSQLRIAIDEDELRRCVEASRADRLLGDRALNQLAFHATGAASLEHAQALARQACARQKDTLAVQWHMLGLLHEEIWRLAPPPEGRGGRCPDADLEKVERAYGIMRDTLKEPVSLARLASMVGLSAARLRRGFYARYDRSPQQALLEVRMRHARALLETGVHVATAAYQVGYGHPANFSAAFGRYFGRTPKSVARGR